MSVFLYFSNQEQCVRYVDSLMDTAVCLTDEVAGVIHEFVPELAQEEVVGDNGLGFAEFPLSGFEVELDVQLLEESCHGILILIFFHLNDLHNFSNRMANTR